jgi:hypothetical protein
MSGTLPPAQGQGRPLRSGGDAGTGCGCGPVVEAADAGDPFAA